MTTLAAAAALGAGALTLSAPTEASAQAAMACSDRTKMIDRLKVKYGELRKGAGLQSDTEMLELFVSKQGSWTILLTRPDGKSCPIAVGDSWQEEKPEFDPQI